MRRGQSPPERFGSVLRLPWSRILLTMAIVGPALWIGGVPPEVVPVFLVVVALACTRLCLRSSERLRVPWIALLGVLAIGATLLQWLPLGLRGLLAPGLDAEVSAALAHAGTNAWPSLSATPGDAAVETSRLVGLTVLCIAAAQLSWRATATMVSASRPSTRSASTASSTSPWRGLTSSETGSSRAPMRGSSAPGMPAGAPAARPPDPAACPAFTTAPLPQRVRPMAHPLPYRTLRFAL